MWLNMASWMEEKKMNEVLAEKLEEGVNEGFVVDTDIKANWAIKTIKEHQAETQRLCNICRNEIMQYEQKIEYYKHSLESSTDYLKSMLQGYMETVEIKETKTAFTYDLVDGKLKLKKATNEFVRDKETLIKFFKDNDLLDYIETTEAPKWGEFKKLINVVGDKVVTEDGQVVDGVTVVEKPAEFEVIL